MKKIMFGLYTDLLSFQFDNGFDVTENDLTDLKNPIINSFLGIQFLYIKNVKGFLVSKVEDKRINMSVYITNEKYEDFEDGYYLTTKYVGNHNKETTIEISEVGIDVSEDFFKFGINTIRGEYLKDELNEFLKEEEKKYNIDVDDVSLLRIEYMPNIENLHFLTEEQIIDCIKDSHKTVVDFRIKQVLATKNNKELLTAQEEKLIKDYDNDIVCEFKSTDMYNADTFTINPKECSITVKIGHRQDDITKYVFKSKEDLKNNMLNKQPVKQVSALQYHDSSKSLFNRNISFTEYKITNDMYGNYKEEEIVSVDFENSLFNYVKVNPSKLKSIYNKAYKEDDFDRFKDKKLIEMYNNLSGIKIDVLTIEDIKVDGLKFDVSASIIDDSTNLWRLKFMNKEFDLNWDIVKKYFVIGLSRRTLFTKKGFIEMCRDLGLSDTEIFDQITKNRILTKLEKSVE